MFEELRAFFEDGELSKKAAASLRDGREIGIQLKTPAGALEGFTFAKNGGRNVFRRGESVKPDVIFVMPEPSARELVTRKFDSVGQVGLHIFEKILSNDPSQKVSIRLKTGVLSLVTGGYFGILTAGGAEVARFLATRGLGSLGKLKDAISKIKG